MLAESSLINRFVDMTDCDQANNRMHMYWGILICILILIHVWSITFPLLEGFSMVVIPGSFEWPFSERSPKGFHHVDPIAKLIMLQAPHALRTPCACPHRLLSP